MHDLKGKMDVVDVAPVFAEAIRRIYNGESVSNLWSLDYWTGVEVVRPDYGTEMI